MGCVADGAAAGHTRLLFSPELFPFSRPQTRSQRNSTCSRCKGLISRAEASYKSGVDNYNANHLDAARMDFDFAIDTMLSSGMDLKGDPDPYPTSLNGC